MISDIRKQLNTPAFKSMVVIVVIGMVVGLIASVFQMARQGSQLPWVLKINKQAIDVAEFNQAYKQQQEGLLELRRRLGAQADMLFGGGDIKELIMQFTMQQLITQTLQDQYIHKLGFRIHPDVAVELLSNPRAMTSELMHAIPTGFLNRDGSFDCARMMQYLQRSQLPIDFFERKLENAVLEHQLRDIVAQASYVPDYMVEAEFVKKYAPRTFTLYTIPMQAIAAQEATKPVSEELLAQFYANKKQNYRIPEKRSGSQWTFNPATYGIQITPAEINSHYQSNKTSYIDKPAQIQIRDIFIATPKGQDSSIARAKADEVLKKAQEQPATFAQLAKEYSNDDKTASKGGLMAPFTSKNKNIAPSLVRAAFVLPEDGAISELVTTPEGFHIIQRVKKEQPTYKSVESVSPAIITELTNKKFKEQFTHDIRTLEGKISEGNKEALDQFVKQKTVQMQPIAVRDQGTDKLTMALFGIRERGNVSYYFDNNKGVLVQLNTITKSHEPEFTNIKEQITKDWHVDHNKQVLQQKLKQLQHALHNKKPLAEIQKEFNVQVKQLPSSTLEAENKELVVLGIPSSQLTQLVIPGSMTSLVAKNDDGVVLQLTEIGTPKEDEAKKDAIKAELIKQKEQETTESFIASLYRNAKIETNEPNMPRLQ